MTLNQASLVGMYLVDAAKLILEDVGFELSGSDILTITDPQTGESTDTDDIESTIVWLMTIADNPFQRTPIWEDDLWNLCQQIKRERNDTP